MRYSAACLLALFTLVAAGCGGGGGGTSSGGGGGGGGGNPQTAPAVALGNNGGGIGGAALTAGGTFVGRVVEMTTKLPVTGAAVCVNDANGAVIAEGVTGADGNCVLASLTTQPTSATFLDPYTGELTSFFGSPQSPLPSYMAITVEHAPNFELTITGLTVGSDVQLVLNGTIVGARDTVTATEIFPVTLTGSAVPPAVGAIGEGKPWLLVLHTHENTTAGTPDTANLLAAAYIADTNGSPGTETPVAITLDATTGAGSNTDGLTTGLATVGTLSGNVSVGTLQFGLIPTLAGVATVSADLDNAFGTWNYQTVLLDTANLQGSLIAPPLASSQAFTLQYPVIPATLSGAAYTKDTRTASLALASAAELLALLSSVGSGTTPDPQAIQDLLASVVILTRRVVGTTPSNHSVSFASLNTLSPAKAYLDIDTGTVDAAAFPGIGAALIAEIDANTTMTSLALALDATGAAAFPTVAGASLTFTQTHIAAATAAGAGGGGAPTGVGYAATPRSGLVTLVPSGDTGTLAAPLPVSLSLGALELGITTPATAATTYNIATDSIAWNASGLSTRQGLFITTITAGDGTTDLLNWTAFTPTPAVSAPAATDYAIRIPTLPTIGPFATHGLLAAHTTMALTLTYLDLEAAGVNPTSFTINQIAGTLAVAGASLSLNPWSVIGVTPATLVQFVAPAAVNPE